MRTRLVALLAVTALALLGCSDDGTGAGDQRTAGGTPRSDASSPATAEPGTGASTGASADAGSTSSGSPSAAASTTVPVYFVGDTPNGPRLFREFQRVDGVPADAALNAASTGGPRDPDYRTLLPRGTFRGVRAGEQIAVPLPDDSWTRRPPGMSESQALLAIQQVVYTVQGVLQQRRPVVFVDGSGAPTQVFGVASEDGFTAADPIRTLALVSVTSPEQGARVRGAFRASGVSSSFEATTPWEIRNAAGTVVRQGSATAAGWMDRLYPWQARVDVSGLRPGRYTFVAMTDDPSDGEGPGPTRDTKAITVG